MPKKYAALVISSILLLLMTSFFPIQAQAVNPSQENPERDYWPTNRWLNTTPEEQGMDSTLLHEMMDGIEENDVFIDSIVIVKNGYIVFEEYPRNYNNESRHIIHSCTKSYTSALVGIAIEEGYIEGVDSKLVDLLPNRTIQNLDERKEDITLEDLLMMTSGLEWDEWTEPYDSIHNSLHQTWNADNNVQHILDLPMEYNPGEVWVYNSGGSHLLSAIVTEATNTSLFDYAMENLFTPLGIPGSNIYWPADNQGIFWGHGGVHMVPRDMAKFGYLYLNNGTWDGEQIVPSNWVQTSKDTLFTFNDFSGYSYQWWTYPTDIVNVYAAQGYQGQFIFVIPELDMVVVFTSSVPPYDVYPQPSILFDYIISAAQKGIPRQIAATIAVTVVTLIIIPLPALFAGVYYRFSIAGKKREEAL